MVAPVTVNPPRRALLPTVALKAVPVAVARVSVLLFALVELTVELKVIPALFEVSVVFAPIKTALLYVCAPPVVMALEVMVVAPVASRLDSAKPLPMTPPNVMVAPFNVNVLAVVTLLTVLARLMLPVLDVNVVLAPITTALLYV